MHQKAHFKGKDAGAHVQEARAAGLEAHGTEASNHLAAFADALREGAFFLLLLFAALYSLKLEFAHLFLIFMATSIGLILWKTGRSGWLAWSRLERLHRLIDQEHYEIEHHRDQEREELLALYKAKGFEGELLEKVVDHLMNDSDRLLKVMIEEELGLSLEAFEHPLKQAWGAFLGSFCSALVFALAYYLSPQLGPFIAAPLLLGVGAFITAHAEDNHLLRAIVWTLAIALLAAGSTYFLIMAL